jgi:hypothetical protein
VLAGAKSSPLDLREKPFRGLADRPGVEGCLDNGVGAPSLPVSELSVGSEQCGSSRCRRSCGRAINLSVGEDRHRSLVVVRRFDFHAPQSLATEPTGLAAATDNDAGPEQAAAPPG